MQYYKLPLSVDKIIKNEEAETCSIEQSVAQFVHLIATSHFGEYDFDKTFGCTIWNIDFDNLASTNKLRYAISESIVKSLTLHEKRLRNISADVKIIQDEFRGEANNRVKKRIEINIKSIKRQTNETFTYLDRFYIAPLANR